MGMTTDRAVQFIRYTVQGNIDKNYYRTDEQTKFHRNKGKSTIVKMKLFVKSVFVMLISWNLLIQATASPQKVAQQSSAGSSPSQAITAGSVNSGIDFTRNMIDWISAFMNNIWRTVPNLMNMFIPNAGSAAAAGAVGAAGAAGSVPTMLSLPSLPSKQSDETDSSQAQDTELLPSLRQISQSNRINKQKAAPRINEQPAAAAAAPPPRINRQPAAAPRKLSKTDVEPIDNEISNADE